ncbi:MAG TPA: hypothetical protein PLY93_03735, partial [Turneriella sp.]|nr:hypothetical protein [Turneriella sp.]
MRNFRWFAFLVPLFFLVGCIRSEKVLQVENGKVDLSASLFSENEIYYLNGQWEFYPNKILSPDEIALGNAIAERTIVPAGFNVYKESM